MQPNPRKLIFKDATNNCGCTSPGTHRTRWVEYHTSKMTLRIAFKLLPLCTVPRRKHNFVIFKVFLKPIFWCFLSFSYIFSSFFGQFGFVQANMADLWLWSYFSDQKIWKIGPQIETAEKERFQVPKFKLWFFPAANILNLRCEAKNSKLVLKKNWFLSIFVLKKSAILSQILGYRLDTARHRGEVTFHAINIQNRPYW